jgi:LacI family transcriptional regulator
MPVRLKDIASALGLSVTTVSRALAGYSDVSQQTRKRVLATAEAMGYVPDATGQRLRMQRTNTLGFIVPTVGPRNSDPFFSELVAGIGSEAARHSYDLLISTVGPGPMESEVYHRYIMGRRVDGLIVVRTRQNDARIALLQASGFPFVAYGRTADEAAFPWVDTDGETGVGEAVKHLVALGHRRIGYVRGPEELMFSALRWRGFRRAMEEYQLAVEPGLIVFGDLTQGGGRAMAGQLLDLQQPPTALILGNDLMALGAITAAQTRGLEVGRDVSIVGFDDIAQAEHAHPALTTLNQPIYQIATLVTTMLIQILEDKPLQPSQVLLTPTLMVRQSTGPASQHKDDRPVSDRRR